MSSADTPDEAMFRDRLRVCDDHTPLRVPPSISQERLKQIVNEVRQEQESPLPRAKTC